MTSQSFDGEYIARFIQRFGYGAARGSSTRGAVGAIIEMTRLMRAGSPTAFTIDGPKGPRYVAKMGAVLLAKKTGQPILPFTISARHWEAKRSWDGFQIPLPFSRARLDIAQPIYGQPTLLTKGLRRNARSFKQRSIRSTRALPEFLKDCFALFPFSHSPFARFHT